MAKVLLSQQKSLSYLLWPSPNQSRSIPLTRESDKGILQAGSSVFFSLVNKTIVLFQIMALIIAGLGFCVSLPFQFLVPEKPNAQLNKLKWYKWFGSIRLYLVSLHTKTILYNRHMLLKKFGAIS